jgi:hypothetical protein
MKRWLKRLRDSEIYDILGNKSETLFDCPNPPHIATLQRWAKGHKSPTPSHELPFPIVPKYKEEVREVFIRQLRSMGWTSEEIKAEIKKLIP